MILAIGYALLASAIIAHETRREKSLRFDQLSVASAFFLANIAVPAMVIHLIVDGAFLSPESLGAFPLLEHVYRGLTVAEKVVVFMGSCFAYIGLAVGYRLVAGSGHGSEGTAASMSTRATLAWATLGILFFVVMLRFGDVLAPGDPVKGLLLSIYFRADDPDFAFERDAFASNAYTVTHTYLLIALIGYALADEHRRWRYRLLAVTLLFVVTAVVASGARRSLLIAALIVYMYVANRGKTYRLKLLVGILAAAVPLLYFGKAVLRGLGVADGSVAIDTDVPIMEQLLVAASEIGISHVESLGTLSLYDGTPRMAVDHALSALRFLPEGMVGLDIPWPERIVRISTAYLTGDPAAQDIPPGYVGQCWIDFPVIGFIVGPLIHGMIFGYIEKLYRRIDLGASPAYLLGYLIVGYIVALPLNSGSLDFIFSIDIALAVAVLLLLNAIASRGEARASPGPAV